MGALVRCMFRISNFCEARARTALALVVRSAQLDEITRARSTCFDALASRAIAIAPCLRRRSKVYVDRRDAPALTPILAPRFAKVCRTRFTAEDVGCGLGFRAAARGLTRSMCLDPRLSYHEVMRSRNVPEWPALKIPCGCGAAGVGRRAGRSNAWHSKPQPQAQLSEQPRTIIFPRPCHSSRSFDIIDKHVLHRGS